MSFEKKTKLKESVVKLESVLESRELKGVQNVTLGDPDIVCLCQKKGNIVVLTLTEKVIKRFDNEIPSLGLQILKSYIVSFHGRKNTTEILQFISLATWEVFQIQLSLERLPVVVQIEDRPLVITDSEIYKLEYEDKFSSAKLQSLLTKNTIPRPSQKLSKVYQKMLLICSPDSYCLYQMPGGEVIKSGETISHESYLNTELNEHYLYLLNREKITLVPLEGDKEVFTVRLSTIPSAILVENNYFWIGFVSGEIVMYDIFNLSSGSSSYESSSEHHGSSSPPQKLKSLGAPPRNRNPSRSTSTKSSSSKEVTVNIVSNQPSTTPTTSPPKQNSYRANFSDSFVGLSINKSVTQKEEENVNLLDIEFSNKVNYLRKYGCILFATFETGEISGWVCDNDFTDSKKVLVRPQNRVASTIVLCNGVIHILAKQKGKDGKVSGKSIQFHSWDVTYYMAYDQDYLCDKIKMKTTLNPKHKSKPFYFELRDNYLLQYDVEQDSYPVASYILLPTTSVRLRKLKKNYIELCFDQNTYIYLAFSKNEDRSSRAVEKRWLSRLMLLNNVIHKKGSWEIDPADIEHPNQEQEGRAIFRQKQVTIKTIKQVPKDTYLLSKLCSLCHPSVLTNYVFVLTPSPMILEEFSTDRTLQDLIHTVKHTITWKFAFSIGLEIISAMNYLHSLMINGKMDPLYLKCLSPSFITVSSLDMNSPKPLVKLSMTGLTLESLEDKYVRYLAPESLSTLIYSEYSDTYTFGVLFWELITQSVPYKDEKGPLQKHILEGNLLELPVQLPGQLLRFFQFCWSKTPSDRPTGSRLESLFYKGVFEMAQLNLTFKPTSVFKPEKDENGYYPILYGREGEFELLQKVHSQIATNMPLVMIKGPVGVGKSSFLNRFSQTTRGCLVLSANCTLFSKRFPFQNLKEFFSSINQNVRLETLMKDFVYQFDSSQLSVLQKLIPSLQMNLKILSGKEISVKSSPLENIPFQKIAKTVYQFLQLIVELVGQVNIILNNIQWIDDESLSVLIYFVDHPMKNVGVFLTYVPKVVEINPNLKSWFKSNRHRMTSIVLKPLSVDTMKQFIANELDLAIDERTDEISKCFHRGTGGMPLQIYEFSLKFTKDELKHKLLSKSRSEILNTTGDTNIITRLPKKLQEVLGIASFLDTRFTAETIMILVSNITVTFDDSGSVSVSDTKTTTSSKSIDSIKQALETTWKKRFLKKTATTGQPSYEFSSDDIQTITYNLFDANQKNFVHLKIAESLYNLYNRKEDTSPELNLMSIANHYYLAHMLVVEDEEIKLRATRVNIDAAIEAIHEIRGCSAAQRYLHNARHLLGVLNSENLPWAKYDDLLWNIYSNSVKTMRDFSDTTVLERLITIMEGHDNTILKKYELLEYKVLCLLNQSNTDAAIHLILQNSSFLGLKIKPSSFEYISLEEIQEAESKFIATNGPIIDFLMDCFQRDTDKPNDSVSRQKHFLMAILSQMASQLSKNFVHWICIEILYFYASNPHIPGHLYCCSSFLIWFYQSKRTEEKKMLMQQTLNLLKQTDQYALSGFVAPDSYMLTRVFSFIFCTANISVVTADYYPLLEEQVKSTNMVHDLFFYLSDALSIFSGNETLPAQLNRLKARTHKANPLWTIPSAKIVESFINGWDESIISDIKSMPPFVAILVTGPLLFLSMYHNHYDFPTMNRIEVVILEENKGSIEEISTITFLALIYYRLALNENTSKKRKEYFHKAESYKKVYLGWENGGRNFEIFNLLSEAYSRVLSTPKASMKEEAYHCLYYFAEALDLSKSMKNTTQQPMIAEMTYEFCKILHLETLEVTYLQKALTLYSESGSIRKVQQLQEILNSQSLGLPLSNSNQFSLPLLASYTTAVANEYYKLQSFTKNQNFNNLNQMMEVLRNILSCVPNNGKEPTNPVDNEALELVNLSDFLRELQNSYSCLYLSKIQLHIRIKKQYPKFIITSRSSLRLLTICLLFSFSEILEKTESSIYLCLDCKTNQTANAVLSFNLSNTLQTISTPPTKFPNLIRSSIDFVENQIGFSFNKINYYVDSPKTSQNTWKTLEVDIPVKVLIKKIGLYMDKTTSYYMFVLDQLKWLGVIENVVTLHDLAKGTDFETIILDDSVEGGGLEEFKKNSPATSLIQISTLEQPTQNPNISHTLHPKNLFLLGELTQL